MFFKRLSRSRSNSQSYVDETYRHDSKANSQYDKEYQDRDHPDSLPTSRSLSTSTTNVRKARTPTTRCTTPASLRLKTLPTPHRP